MAYAFPCGEPAIVLQAEPDEEVDLPVGHVHDLLDGPLGLVVVGQERQFFDEFRIDGLLDKLKERLCLGRHVKKNVYSSCGPSACSHKKNDYILGKTITNERL
ncbi:MAG: hypothetical protein ABIF87_05450 [Pseudomonadota bacterium]